MNAPRFFLVVQLGKATIMDLSVTQNLNEGPRLLLSLSCLFTFNVTSFSENKFMWAKWASYGISFVFHGKCAPSLHWCSAWHSPKIMKFSKFHSPHVLWSDRLAFYLSNEMPQKYPSQKLGYIPILCVIWKSSKLHIIGVHNIRWVFWICTVLSTSILTRTFSGFVANLVLLERHDNFIAFLFQ
jgi:hypothetical protein